MNIDLKIIGNNIFRYRQERKISQKKLSKLMGKAEATISRIERGVKAPSINILINFSKIFDVSIDNLLEGAIIYRQYENPKAIGDEKTLNLLDELHNANTSQKIFILNTIKSYIDNVKINK